MQRQERAGLPLHRGLSPPLAAATSNWWWSILCATACLTNLLLLVPHNHNLNQAKLRCQVLRSSQAVRFRPIALCHLSSSASA